MAETIPSTIEPITNPIKIHVNDPRRIEGGRRLGKISQEDKPENVHNVKKQLRRAKRFGCR